MARRQSCDEQANRSLDEGFPEFFEVLPEAHGAFLEQVVGFFQGVYALQHRWFLRYDGLLSSFVRLHRFGNPCLSQIIHFVSIPYSGRTFGGGRG